MRLTTALTLATLTFASPVLAQEVPVAQVEVCRPATDNPVRTLTQYIAYPGTPVCTRPYIRLHNNISHPNSVQELGGDLLRLNYRFQDISGNQAFPCPTPASPTSVCFYK